MARRHWAKIAGRKVYGTLAEVQKLAKSVANEIGRAVQVGFDERPTRARRRTLARNPDPGAYVHLWHEKEKARASRKAYLDATKARRLAMSLRKRGKVYQDEMRKAATARFVVVARNRRESWTLYRPTRASAAALGRQFEAAGYQVALKPV